MLQPILPPGTNHLDRDRGQDNREDQERRDQESEDEETPSFVAPGSVADNKSMCDTEPEVPCFTEPDEPDTDWEVSAVSLIPAPPAAARRRPVWDKRVKTKQHKDKAYAITIDGEAILESEHLAEETDAVVQWSGGNSMEK